MRTLGERKQLDAHVTKSAALRGFAPRSRWRVTRLRAARDIEWIKKGGQAAASANARATEIYGHRGNNTDTQLDVTVAGSSGAIVLRSHAPGRRVGDPHFLVSVGEANPLASVVKTRRNRAAPIDTLDALAGGGRRTIGRHVAGLAC